MNWIKFTIWLSAIYGSYYGLLISWDFLGSAKSKNIEERNELTFVETETPVRLQSGTDDAGPARLESPIVSSGGVRIKQMFSLAQQEAIEFTRAVSFS
ncbi:hypothetical protein SAMN05192574_105299 [Mucilaginibacter gossypiicola]|uniref:Uncharacterized protein n=1 Tax=Mucilaginibacter gossypiicola TaxID=551995 RepID=A0A1H8LYN4_9SPHI|nr:hypothetical protein [Mucilaginibacter gossypiicola]SEO09976.1 hypothetical protein SAMN05192574_105299 [Mucilaginibacter gossypiicola]